MLSPVEPSTRRNPADKGHATGSIVAGLVGLVCCPRCWASSPLLDLSDGCNRPVTMDDRTGAGCAGGPPPVPRRWQERQRPASSTSRRGVVASAPTCLPTPDAGMPNPLLGFGTLLLGRQRLIVTVIEARTPLFASQRARPRQRLLDWRGLDRSRYPAAQPTASPVPTTRAAMPAPPPVRCTRRHCAASGSMPFGVMPASNRGNNDVSG
jgi:hypothetical protein